MSAITVRESIDPADLARVLEILHAAFALHDGRIDPPSAAHRETVEALMARLATETLLVAERDGAIAGCIWCAPSGRDVYIGRLAVDPECHGTGAGRALLLASIEWARSRKASTMSLGVRIELTENIAFFERHGFAITRSESHPGYMRPTNYHMELRIE